MQDLKGKKILIVGGSSGIGLATAQAAFERGAIVTIASRGEENSTRLQVKSALPSRPSWWIFSRTKAFFRSSTRRAVRTM